MLTTVGLIMDIVGALLLGYGALTELPKNFQKQRLEGYKNHLSEFLTTQISKVLELPDTVYPKSEKSKLIEALESEYQPQIDSYLSQIKDLDTNHSERTYNWGWYGVGLLVIGFALQIIGSTTSA